MPRVACLALAAAAAVALDEAEAVIGSDRFSTATGSPSSWMGGPAIGRSHHARMRGAQNILGKLAR